MGRKGGARDLGLAGMRKQEISGSGVLGLGEEGDGNRILASEGRRGTWTFRSEGRGRPDARNPEFEGRSSGHPDLDLREEPGFQASGFPGNASHPHPQGWASKIRPLFTIRPHDLTRLWRWIEARSEGQRKGGVWRNGNGNALCWKGCHRDRRRPRHRSGDRSSFRLSLTPPLDPPPQWLEETSAQGFRQLLELNLLGTYTLTKLTLPHLRKSQGNVINISSLVGAIGQSQAVPYVATKLALPHLRKSQGNVINISSLVGAIGQSQAVPYVATKGAVTALTKALALDESQYGVRVNCISPGNIWTPLWEELAASTPDPTATIREGTLAQPLGRMGQPAEVAAAAVFLASEASFCTGTELLVTGGAELGYGRKAGQAAPTEAPTTPS
ncbi:17-beta-hydroxysteroid dehydrogenase 14 isoform X1 [Odocoileus virginianus]|uniref:17-beta-hydroxysteroid dehydrogenase 14 isoform X1 n=1 Tax=Odocoileus virginianus TaxID=9874 RepID=A0ABM4GTL9_ODOVR